MSTIPFRLAFLDPRLQGLAQAVGLRRTYFDTRERLRAKIERIDLSAMRAQGAVFVHVPKCAGTTIITQAKLAAGHRSAVFMRWHAPDLWDSAFTFGFVRNPYERLVSAFHYLRSDKTSARDGAWGRANLGAFADFQAFAAALETRSVRMRTLGWLHFLPQTYFLCDRRNRVLVDFVGRTERFAEDLATVNARAGLALEARRERQVARPDGPPAYTAASARLVADIYAQDFETFGYPREPFPG